MLAQTVSMMLRRGSGQAVFRILQIENKQHLLMFNRSVYDYSAFVLTFSYYFTTG